MADPNAYVKGAVGTATNLFSSGDIIDERLEPEISAAIQMVHPNRTQLLTFLEKLNGGVISVGQPYFTMQERWLFQDTAILTTNAAAGATTLYVGTAAHLIPQMVLMNTRTGTHVRISSITGNTLTVVDAVGTTPGAAMLANDTLIVLATAQEEGASALQMRMRATDRFTLYTQLMEHNFGGTSMTYLRKYRGMTELDRQTEDNVMEFKRFQQRTYLLGEPNMVTTDGLIRTYSAGLRYFCNLYNQVDLLGALSYETLCEALFYAGRYSDAEMLWGFTSQRVINKLLGLPEVKDAYRTARTETTLGFQIKTIAFGDRRVELLAVPELDKPGLNKEILVADLNTLRIREFEAMKSREIRKDTGDHARVFQLFCNRGLGCDMPQACGRVYNIGM